jgi:hypothetical protein
MRVRLKDWRPRLDAFLDSCDRKPLVWGELDCALFVAGCVQAMTGEDFAASFRGTYVDEAGALAAIKAQGFDSLADIPAAHFLEIPVSGTRLGDIALVTPPGAEPCLALVAGANLICMTLRGKGCLPLTRATRAFKVG